MAGALWAGYATAGTDTGHTGGPATGDWALGHPEKVVDFGWRAIHLMTVEAKAADCGVLWRAGEVRLLERLLGGRRAGTERGTALSRRL